MEGDPATKETVLAWMAATGRGYSKAAAHFGLTPGTVDGWQRRDAKARRKDDAKTTQSGNVVTLESRRQKPKSEEASKEPTKKPPAPSVDSRARATESLGPELREHLRRGVSGLARFIGQAATSAGTGEIDLDLGPPDMQQVAHAARALDILLGRLPDLMAFDEKTATPEPASQAALGTDEGNAAMVAELASLPEHLLREALARRRA